MLNSSGFHHVHGSLRIVFCFSYAETSKKKALWALKIFKQWKTKHNIAVKADGQDPSEVIQGSILKMNKKHLSFALCCFVLEVTNEQNEIYPRETLYSLLMSLQIYCHSHGVYHHFLSDSEFTDV